MDKIIELIDEVTNSLFKCDMNSYVEKAQELVNCIMIEMPKIISYYYDSKMQDEAKNATYWPNIMEQFIGSIEKGDDYVTCDILVFGIKEELILLKRILVERGVEL